jgi:hypothetical protein
MERHEHERVLQRLRRDAVALAARFRLQASSIEAERPQVRRRLGVCYADGSIRVRLRHARTGRILKYSSLVDTLCHELAHLRHFNHGMRFQILYRGILEYARREGIYQPDPISSRGRPGMAEELRIVGAQMRAPRDPRIAPPRPRSIAIEIAAGEQLELF